MNKEIFQKDLADWEKNAPFYAVEAGSPFKAMLREEMKEKFLMKRGEKVLDLGAGVGDLAEELKKDLGCKVTCVDFSSKMRELALKKYPRLKYVVASAHKLPFKKEGFDVVIMGGVLHHLKAQGILEKGVAEIRRVLKKGGRFGYLDRSASPVADIYETILATVKKLFLKLKKNYAASSTTWETSLSKREMENIREGFNLVSHAPAYSMPFKLLVVIANVIFYTFGKKYYLAFERLTSPLAYLFEKHLNFAFWETERIELLEKND